MMMIIPESQYLLMISKACCEKSPKGKHSGGRWTGRSEFMGQMGSLPWSTGVRDNNNIALLLYGLPCKEKSDQPADGQWNGRNISLGEAV